MKTKSEKREKEIEKAFKDLAKACKIPSILKTLDKFRKAISKRIYR